MRLGRNRRSHPLASETVLEQQDRSPKGARGRSKRMAAWPRRGRQRQSGMDGSHPCQTASARGQAAMATNNFRVLEAQVRAFSVRNCVEPGINSRLKSREPVLAGDSDMQMGMECPQGAQMG